MRADPGLLVALLQALLDWAFEHCTAPTMLWSVSAGTWPPQPLLRCAFRWRAPDLPAIADATALDTLAWRLVQQTCQAMGLKCEREDTPQQVQVDIAFPGGQTSWPTVAGEGAGQVPPLPGCRAMVLSDQAGLLAQMRQALAGMQLQARYLDSSPAALAPHDEGPPHVLVADAALPGLDLLCAQWGAGGWGPALVLVSAAGTALEVRSSGHQEVLRVGRDQLLRDLGPALRYALARA